MSGHSKWSTIKHQKGVADVRKGQLFTKLAREIAVAVRQEGGNVESNFRLRLAIQKARDQSMPMDNIERAVKRAVGGGDTQEQFDEITYEGYGPGGVALMVQALTSNRNRTASDVRAVLSHGGGSMGEAGCVSWNFESRGVLTLTVDTGQADDVALLAIDAGAEDFNAEGGFIEIYTRPEHLEAVRRELETRGMVISTAEVSMVPKQEVPLTPGQAEKTLRLLDALEELADVQKVYTNADFPEAVLESYQREG